MYKISEKSIKKRKVYPLFGVMGIVAMAFLMVLAQDTENYNWILFFFVAGIMSFLFCVSSFLGIKKFLKSIKNHTLEITTEGLKSIQGESYTLISWRNVDSITEKTKNNKTVKLTLKTKEHGLMDFREYGDLEKLSLELKKTY